MVNHFRCLLLNLPAAGEVTYGQYVPPSFQGVRPGPPEGELHGALFGEGRSREWREFAATVYLRVILDHTDTREIMEEVDPRLSFDPRARMVDTLPDDSAPRLPGMSDLWAAAGSIRAFRQLFVSGGEHAETLTGLYNSLSSLRRKDHKLAVALCAYCLKLDELL